MLISSVAATLAVNTSGSLVTQALKAARPLVDVDVPKNAQDASGTLLDLPLDADLCDLLAPLLLKFGFQVAPERIPDRFGTITRTVTRASNHQSQLYFISVPRWVLEEAQEASLAAFTYLSYTFPKNSTVYIVSRGLAVIDVPFNPILDEWREAKAIRAAFIPWPHLERLRRETSDDARIRLLQQMLKLEAVPTAAPAPPPSATPLSAEEKNAVVEILVRQASDPFSKPQDVLQDLVSAAGLAELGKFAGKWGGDPNQDAAKLLAWTTDFRKEFPAGQERVGESTLGYLLKAVLDKYPSPNDVKILVKIIVGHGLIRDAATVAALNLKLT